MKIEGIILAAGLSTRAGTNKLILEIDHVPVIERCLLSMYDYCSRIIVVGGHKIDDIYPITKKYPKIDLAYNQDYLSAMFGSVKTGLRFLEGDRFFLTPGDYPMINKTTYKEMLGIDDDIVVPMHKGKKGHPVLIKTSLADEIINDSSISSLRDYIERKGSTTLNVIDPGILTDIDTIENYKGVLKTWDLNP